MMVEKICLFLKYNEIWNNVKKMLNIKFHSQPVYNEKYVKAKVKALNGVINTIFSDDKVPTEGIHYICNAAIYIDSVILKLI